MGVPRRGVGGVEDGCQVGSVVQNLHGKHLRRSSVVVVVVTGAVVVDVVAGF